MSILKKNYGWIIVMIFASLPLIPLFNIGFSGTEEGIDMLYHISGEFAIRWMTAVLTCTPFFILFGVTNLFVRQAMGIATAVWSFLHFIIFIAAEGFMETFTQVNYVAGFIAVLILIP
ncbi:MAG: ferric reductase, partial [Chitinophagaceae bacterium]|nr:ferric reductase [Chitinophagaceae bacterium]